MFRTETPLTVVKWDALLGALKGSMRVGTSAKQSAATLMLKSVPAVATSPFSVVPLIYSENTYTLSTLSLRNTFVL